MQVGSLFSGIGGLDLGLERAGMQVIWQVEKDPYAQKVLRKHWPTVRLYDDVRTVHGREDWCDGKLAGCCLDNVDLICGGFPCQDISNAGKRAGIGGERSGLWREFHRIIDEVRPSWVLIENVATGRARWLGYVLRDLAAIGYRAEWRCVEAREVGAPHIRDRCFVVAYPERATLRQQPRWGSWPDGEGPAVFGLDGPTRFVTGTSAWPPVTDLGGVAHGIPARVDRLRCLGNAVVPQVAEFVGRLILNADP